MQLGKRLLTLLEVTRLKTIRQLRRILSLSIDFFTGYSVYFVYYTPHFIVEKVAHLDNTATLFILSSFHRSIGQSSEQNLRVLVTVMEQVERATQIYTCLLCNSLYITSCL